VYKRQSRDNALVLQLLLLAWVLSIHAIAVRQPPPKDVRRVPSLVPVFVMLAGGAGVVALMVGLDPPRDLPSSTAVVLAVVGAFVVTFLVMRNRMKPRVEAAA